MSGKNLKDLAVKLLSCALDWLEEKILAKLWPLLRKVTPNITEITKHAMGICPPVMVLNLVMYLFYLVFLVVASIMAKVFYAFVPGRFAFTMVMGLAFFFPIVCIFNTKNADF